MTWRGHGERMKVVRTTRHPPAAAVHSRAGRARQALLGCPACPGCPVCPLLQACQQCPAEPRAAVPPVWALAADSAVQAAFGAAAVAETALSSNGYRTWRTA